MQRSQRRSTKVCTRCRQRKTKCDFKFPQCTPCTLANATCLGFDPATKQAVPRSLVKSLEARVAQLEAQLLAFQSAPQNLPYSMASRIAQATIAFGVPKSGPYLQSKISSALFLRPSCPPLAITPVARSRGVDISEGSESSKRPRNPQKTPYRSNLINLGSVPHSALERMVRNYTDTHLPQYPIISASRLDHLVQQFRNEDLEDPQEFAISASPSLGPFESFVVFIVLAISANTLTWRAETQAREASESFYKSAMKHLQLLEDYSEIKELQISLLLAHYAHMCPERVDNWTCISNAVRIVLSLGLYRECHEGLDPEQAKLRSGLFWVTYGMERSLCTNLRLPLSFPEEAITTKLEDPMPEGTDSLFTTDDVKKKSSANHIYRYRILETEVHRVLYLEEDLHKFGSTSVEEWIRDVTSRLETWYREAQTYTPYNMLEFKHVQFHHLKARIHRPTPRLRTTSPQDWGIVLKASRNLIDDYLGQERQRRLFYPWHGVHILFETASIALDASWSARDYQPLIEEAADMLQTRIPQCLYLLNVIGERWNDATECVNKLSPLVQRVCSAFYMADHTAHDPSVAEEINGLLFSDRPPMWNLGGFEVGDFGFEESLFLDEMLVEEMEFLQWAPDWDIMPAEIVMENNE
ncbi:fungal-specific transcription factor domain-containing protein [Aspergillus cavernicola]|uniref:Fungal-specific transcription factor domain-containing protein n=1 Tax=Aspergillus cavernicola TaxID=176166 RepID=A0ABR4IZX8_9EURO